jgi:hypothetical protein
MTKSSSFDRIYSNLGKLLVLLMDNGTVSLSVPTNKKLSILYMKHSGLYSCNSPLKFSILK